jgi:hypothetical protein
MNGKVDYLENPWKPVPQTVIKDNEICKMVNDEGFVVKELFSKKELSELNELYSELHQIDQKDGGMFYSVYSQNLDYRKKIHEQIGSILSNVLEEHFQNYRVVINSFVVKASGPKSEFYLHQDTTGLDERSFSPLNLWIPLEDVDITNGCIGIIPKSHRFFSPYRSISFPAPFDGIQDEVRRYVRPIKMKQGEALIFDNRVVHNSYTNQSGKTRIAVVCGLFPKEAKLQTCFKPAYELGEKVEFIEHEDAFLLKHPNFLINCQSRPNTGISKGWVDDKYQGIEKDEFQKLCTMHGVLPHSEFSLPMGECNLISEPSSL